MSDVRANSGVPVTAQFVGVSTPSACAPLVVDSATGKIYSWKTGDVIIASGALGTVTSVAESFTGGLISVGGSPITTSGTLALTVAGTSGGIPYFSGTTTWASSGLLAANSIVIGGGSGTSPSTTTTGTGVLTALGVNTGTAGAFLVNGGVLGTPSSGVGTNLTGTATGLTVGNATTSVNLSGGTVSATSGTFSTTLGITGKTTTTGGIDGGATGTTAGTSYYFSSDTVIYYCDAAGANSGLTGMKVNKVTSSGRSINAAGTINASGADYSEYERKASDCGVVAAGQIIGFNTQGQITDKWSDAISFGVKSTKPSYVGGDAWGNEESLGMIQSEDPIAFAAKYESERQKVDRIAYCGKVPVNVLGSKPGQYIEASRGPNDAIVGICVPYTKPNTVGRVRSILPDGRAEIVVIFG